jgi:uncharacterized protein YndB with AHSA1/START domain
METTEKTTITIQSQIAAPIDSVWKKWTTPSDIMQWNNASPDWHTPRAENDLRKGGKFVYRMEARDGSFGFDFGGEYEEVIPKQKIAYRIGDGRKVVVTFTLHENFITVEESFEAEQVNPVDMQRAGWQAILDNFKKYTEAK